MARTTVRGVGGIFFRSDNPAELAKWYSEQLGVPIEGAEAGGMVSAIFQWRDAENPDQEGMTVWALFPRDTDYLGDGPVMVNYRVDDLDAMLAQLREAGVWIDPNQQDFDYGRFAWIRDPEGNRIELWQPIGE